MKKLILIPTAIITGISPVISLVGCNGNNPEPQFIWEYKNEYALLSGYEGTLPRNLIIPGYHSFPDHPNCPTCINDYVFYNNTNIQSVTIEEGAVDIDNWAFAKCTKLSQISFPESLEWIGWNAFESCAIQNVYIPANVNYVYSNPWAGCNLNSITVSSKNPYYYVENNCLIENNDNYSCLKAVSNNFTIPDDITNLILGENCISLSTNFTTLNIPENVISLEEDEQSTPIYNCPNLEEIYVNENNQNFCTSDDHKTLYYKEYPFENDLILVSSVASEIPNNENITEIWCGAFNYNDNVTSIVIPKNVTYISSPVFVHCKNVTSVTIDSENETYISPDGSNVVMHYIDYSDSWTLIMGCSSSHIPDENYHDIELGYQSFSYIDLLPTITIPKSVTNITHVAFAESNVENVVYEGTKNEWIEITKDTSDHWWHMYVPCHTKVHCTDGDIEYEPW